MPKRRSFEAAFKMLHREFSAKTKRAFIDDIRGQIEEDADIEAILSKPYERPRYLAVTFDRRKNDGNFSYQYFDVILVMLDAVSGGNGIYKPSNQMRAIQWNGKKADLLLVLRYFARNNPQVMFRRALILPFPVPPIGYRIDTTVHMR